MVNTRIAHRFTQMRQILHRLLNSTFKQILEKSAAKATIEQGSFVKASYQVPYVLHVAFLILAGSLR